MGNGRTGDLCVDGVAIGTQLNLNNAAYREYKCSPSDQFSGLTWCQKARTEKDRGKAYGAAYSLLHGPDGNVVYINRSQEPAFCNSTQAQQDIDAIRQKLGESARPQKMPSSGPAGSDLWHPARLRGAADQAVSDLSEKPEEKFATTPGICTVGEGRLADYPHRRRSGFLDRKF